jgi:hypothetical protein
MASTMTALVGGGALYSLTEDHNNKAAHMLGWGLAVYALCAAFGTARVFILERREMQRRLPFALNANTP